MGDVTELSRGELLRLLYEFDDKITALEAENAHLREQLQQRGKKSGDGTVVATVPGFVKANSKGKRKKNRKRREGSYHRQNETPTATMVHGCESCPKCGGTDLGKPWVSYSRQVIDIPEVRYTVTEHVVMARLCGTCKHRCVPVVDLSQAVLGGSKIGIRLASMVAIARDRLRLPFGKIKEQLELAYGLKLSEGELVRIVQEVAKAGKPRYDALLTKVQGSAVVHADETGGRENGKNGYFWSFSTGEVHYLIYRKSRGSQVVREIVGEGGEKFNGVLITDFYAAYATYVGFHQRCLVHYLRDIKELQRQHQKHPPVNRWAKQVKGLIKEAKAWGGPGPAIPLGVAAQERIDKQHEYEQRLEQMCTPYLKRTTPMSTLCARAINFLPEMFTFVRFSGVSSDNNAAERAIRHTVVQRKISGGTRSEKGSETKVILTSLFDTWQLQAVNPLQACMQMLTAYP